MDVPGVDVPGVDVPGVDVPGVDVPSVPGDLLEPPGHEHERVPTAALGYPTGKKEVTGMEEKWS